MMVCNIMKGATTHQYDASSKGANGFNASLTRHEHRRSSTTELPVISNSMTRSDQWWFDLDKDVSATSMQH